MIDYFTGLINTLGDISPEVIQQVIQVLHHARLNKRNIFMLGNGGSASTASHFAADLSKNTYSEKYPSFRAIALTDNMAIFSAYANDEGYENVFSRQIAALANPRDIVIAISASGNSLNVVRALEVANRMNLVTIGFTGFTGGKVRSLVDIHLHVPSDVIEQVEDIHLLLEHMICKSLREKADELSGLIRPLKAPLAEIIQPKPVQLVDSETNAMHLHHLLAGGLQAPHNLGDLLRLSLRLSLEGTGADSGSILMLNDGGQVVDAALAYGQQILAPSAQQLADLIECGLAGWVFRNRQAALVVDTRSDPRWLKRAWDEQGEPARSAISVPLLGEEKVSGVLTLVGLGQFNQGHLVLLLAFSTLITLGKKDLA